MREVGNDERVRVVVFVDVFDIVEVDVGIIPRAKSLAPYNTDT